eukprot:TRINITY_DN1618_c0_g1_i1.p1 TRINITY_DN1618_c0_g1~~TRINITY_DN1618_c0_g1_i1.p1  ORF type:complete len:258 (-),score=47.47 TRINITY_DN1618_c0_g1_i1:89-862(-)
MRGAHRRSGHSYQAQQQQQQQQQQQLLQAQPSVINLQMFNDFIKHMSIGHILRHTLSGDSLPPAALRTPRDRRGGADADDDEPLASFGVRLRSHVNLPVYANYCASWHLADVSTPAPLPAPTHKTSDVHPAVREHRANSTTEVRASGGALWARLFAGSGPRRTDAVPRTPPAGHGQAAAAAEGAAAAVVTAVAHGDERRRRAYESYVGRQFAVADGEGRQQFAKQCTLYCAPLREPPAESEALYRANVNLVLKPPCC